jgi:Pvc16 N-terminal domain
MATLSAIAATSEAIIRLLRSSYDPAQFNNVPLEFQVYVANDFLNPMDEGVSLLLYRIFQDGTNRTPPGRPQPNGQRGPTKLPLEIHFLLTAWAKTASLQHELAGWMMRTLEDNPILYPSLLNSYKPDVFFPEETVEIGLSELSTEDLFNIWDVIIRHVYQLSVPYVARVVRIESPLTNVTGFQVRQRSMEYQNALASSGA